MTQNALIDGLPMDLRALAQDMTHMPPSPTVHRVATPSAQDQRVGVRPVWQRFLQQPYSSLPHLSDGFLSLFWGGDRHRKETSSKLGDKANKQ